MLELKYKPSLGFFPTQHSDSQRVSNDSPRTLEHVNFEKQHKVKSQSKLLIRCWLVEWPFSPYRALGAYQRAFHTQVFLLICLTEALPSRDGTRVKTLSMHPITLRGKHSRGIILGKEWAGDLFLASAHSLSSSFIRKLIP